MSEPPTDADSLRLLEAYRAGIWRHLRMLGADADLADDLTQDAFLVWLRKPPEVVTPEQLPAWLRGVARNLLRNARRQGRTLAEIPADSVAESVWAKLVGDGDGEDRLMALRECVATLADADRELLDRRYRDGAPLEELASLSMSKVEAVRSKLRRIQQRLFDCVNRRIRPHG